jgi:hypothetical protein
MLPIKTIKRGGKMEQTKQKKNWLLDFEPTTERRFNRQKFNFDFGGDWDE